MLLDLGLSQISLSRSLFPRPCPVRVEQQRAAPGHADHPIHRFTVIPGEGTPKTLDPILNQTFDGCVQYWGDEIVEMTAYSGVLGMSMRMQRELQFRNKTYPTMLYFLGDGFVQKMRVMYPKMAWLPLSWRENGNIETRNAKTKLKRVQNLLVLSREWGNDPQ